MTTSGRSPPSTDPLAPWRADRDTLVPVRVTPRARAGTVELATAADGSPLLRVSVTAAPDRGRANAAVIALVARAAGASKSDFSVAQGAASRDKLLRWSS